MRARVGKYDLEKGGDDAGKLTITTVAQIELYFKQIIKRRGSSHQSDRRKLLTGESLLKEEGP